MESLRKYTRPELSSATTGRDLAPASEIPGTVSADPPQIDSLQSNENASTSQATGPMVTVNPPVTALDKSHLPPRTSATSLGWDRRFRYAGISATHVGAANSDQQKDPAPVQEDNAAAAERSLLQRGARSVAQVK